MPKEQVELLNCRRLPGRITSQQASWLIGVPEYALPILVKAGLVKRLGNSKANTVPWFSSASILRLAEDEHAMSKATSLIVETIRYKNGLSLKEPKSPSEHDEKRRQSEAA